MRSTGSPLQTAIAGGILAGALDITFACTYWAIKASVPPKRILQSVASGLLGQHSFTAGWLSAALGFVLHFAMTIGMSLAFFFAARRLELLRELPVISGGLYGLALYYVMTYVVVPLSAASPGSSEPLWRSLSILAHVVLVGIPIAFMVGRALRPERAGR